MAWWLVEEETQRCMHEHSVRCGTDATTDGRYSNTAGIGRDHLRHAADAHAIWRPGHAPNVQLSRDQTPLHRPKPCRANWLTLGRKRGATSAGATDSQPTPTGDIFLSDARMEGWVDDGFGMQHHRSNPAHSGHGLISHHTLARPRSGAQQVPDGWQVQSRRGPMRPFRGWSSRVPPLLCAGVEP